MKNILCIDGGGIKGIIPAYILMKIEEQIEGNIIDHFNLVAGTSTGGIIAGCLSSGYSAKDIFEFYRTQSEAIFKNSFKYRLKSIWGWRKSKYLNDELDKALYKLWGEKQLKDLKTDFLTTAYNMTDNKPRFFSKVQEGNYLLKDVIKATASAPTYFRPTTINGKEYIDGGVFASNPSMCAYSEARSLYKIAATDMFIVSIGTGSRVESYKEVGAWGKLNWLAPIVDVMLASDNGVIHYQLSQIFSAVGLPQQYIRISSMLERNKGVLDDASKENIEDLTIEAEIIYNKNKTKISKLIRKLNS